MHVLITLYTITASQMWELVNIFPFIVANDMPPDDDHHNCFMLLSDIATIMFSPVVAKDQIPLLKLMINRFDAVSAYMRKMDRYGLSDF